MSPADRRDAAYSAALRLLAARERSEAELRQRLAQKGFDRDTVIAVLDRLQAAGLQQDARFAEAFAASAAARDYGPDEIRRRLRSKGVDAELAARAAVSDPEDESERARRAASRRVRALAGIPPQVARKRLVEYLVRRGYPFDVALATVEEHYPDDTTESP